MKTKLVRYLYLFFCLSLLLFHMRRHNLYTQMRSISSICSVYVYAYTNITLNDESN